MTQTQRIIAALAAEQRAKLPGEWFSRICKCCFDKFKPGDNAEQFVDNCWRGEPIFPRDHHIYTGPDLTRPDQLHALLAVCDAVSNIPCDIDYWFDDNGGYFKCLLFATPTTFHETTGPTRTAACLAALCAALKIGEGTHG